MDLDKLKKYSAAHHAVMYKSNAYIINVDGNGWRCLTVLHMPSLSMTK